MRIGVVGATGFIGGHIAWYFEQKDHDVTRISRQNQWELKRLKKYDILIHAAGNSRKYKAEKDPKYDFENSVVLAHKVIHEFTFDKIVFISTIDVYHSNEYGHNRRVSEKVLERCPNFLILRLSSVYGDGSKKGVIHDLKYGTGTRISIDSVMNFIDVKEIAPIIEDNIYCEDQILDVINVQDTKMIEFSDMGYTFGSEYCDYSTESIGAAYRLNCSPRQHLGIL